MSWLSWNKTICAAWSDYNSQTSFTLSLCWSITT